jgi:hypothetical protein
MRSRARFVIPVWVLMAVAHFGVSQLILPLTTALTAYAAGHPDGPGFGVMVLVRLTRLLHLPLVTLALYPREWFPGGWIYIPLALNSLIWGAALAGLVGLYRRLAPR